MQVIITNWYFNRRGITKWKCATKQSELLFIFYEFKISPWKAPAQQGIADTHTLPPTDTALLQSHHSRAPRGHTHTHTHIHESVELSTKSESAHLVNYDVNATRSEQKHTLTVRRTRAEQQRWFLIFFNVFFYVHMILRRGETETGQKKVESHFK